MTTTTTRTTYSTRLEFHRDFKVVFSIISHLCAAMEELNKSDSDESPLPSDLSSRQSAYGFASKALREVVLAQFGFDIYSIDIEWGASGGCWSNDLKEALVKHLVIA
jgi:hypothetical protein